MPWIIKSESEISFCPDTGKILTEDGYEIAIIRDSGNRIDIFLGMRSYFESDDGEIKCFGHNGCEEHVLSHVWLLDDLGGRITFNKGMGLFWKESLKDEKNITVTIAFARFVTFPYEKDDKKNKGFFSHLLDGTILRFCKSEIH